MNPRHAKRLVRPVLACALLALTGLASWTALAAGDRAGAGSNAAFRSPAALDWSPDGSLLAIADRTAGVVAFANRDGKLVREVRLNGEPAAVAFGPDGACYVAEYGAASVAQVDAASGKVTRRLPCGRYPAAVAVAGRQKLLLAANSGLDSVSLIDLASGREKGRVAVLAEPVAIAVSGDEALAAVANLRPLGDASQVETAAAVTLIDLAKAARIADVRLPGGSTNLRDVTFSPDGRWVYAVHTLGRVTLPTTQLERGWVNTNALSVIDVAARKLHATVLLDRLTRGAADPWAIDLSADGGTAWIAIAGCHELARVDLAGLHALLEGKAFELPPGRQMPTVFQRIARDPAARADLANDLVALYQAGLIERIPLGGKGARSVAVRPDGKTVAAGLYFSGQVAAVSTDGLKVASRLQLVGRDEQTPQRWGEMLFFDGDRCFQNWLSCGTCHPDGRADGLNWDLLNDGIGNPKNTRSLLWSGKTPPVMSLGVRAKMEIAVEAGFKYIQFVMPGEGEVEAVSAYIDSLEPRLSPYLTAEGQLTPLARQGKAIFESDAAACAKCHPGPLWTDLKSYDVGTRARLDRNDRFDTPTLVEMWRTGPFLHHGSAVTLDDVLDAHNKADRHGRTSQLSAEQKKALAEYLRSL